MSTHPQQDGSHMSWEATLASFAIVIGGVFALYCIFSFCRRMDAVSNHADSSDVTLSSRSIWSRLPRHRVRRTDEVPSVRAADEAPSVTAIAMPPSAEAEQQYYSNYGTMRTV